jgi:hypothetical protein
MRTAKGPATTESTFTELHARKIIVPTQTGITGPHQAHVPGDRRRQAVAAEAPFDCRDERVLIAGDAMNFEAAPGDLALEISALAGCRPSPLARRLDVLLKNPCGVRWTHRGREFVLAKWRPQILAQPAWCEFSPGDPFGFKHCEVRKVTEAAR